MQVRDAGFPPGFLWGVATSAYQIEGGVDLDDRGPSIWDTFCATPGKVRGGDDGSLACDHRRRMRDDVALMAELRLRAYRFSIAWPRVQPTGVGAVSKSGLDFYLQLVDELLKHDIEPVVTLYHWDLPQALEDAGGWPARDTAKRFADYASIVGSAIGDRVRHWSTLNEPWCSAMLGYGSGIHAPGVVDPAAAVKAAHHLLLAHGLGVDALRATIRDDAEVGITLNPCPVIEADETDADHDAMRRVDGVMNRLWYDAILRGKYPDDVLDDFTAVSDLSHIHVSDLAQIARPIDAIGVNYYCRRHVRYGVEQSTTSPWSTWPGSPDIEEVLPDTPTTAMHWPIEPEGLIETLTRLHDDYDAPPLYVHENGAAFDDVADASGYVDDTDRVRFLEAHVAACQRALELGVDLRGYFVWSFMDNFEWAHGYRYRFGIVRIEPDSLRRVPKRSAYWFAQVANGVSSGGRI